MAAPGRHATSTSAPYTTAVATSLGRGQPGGAERPRGHALPRPEPADVRRQPHGEQRQQRQRHQPGQRRHGTRRAGGDQERRQVAGHDHGGREQDAAARCGARADRGGCRSAPCAAPGATGRARFAAGPGTGVRRRARTPRRRRSRPACTPEPATGTRTARPSRRRAGRAGRPSAPTPPRGRRGRRRRRPARGARRGARRRAHRRAASRSGTPTGSSRRPRYAAAAADPGHRRPGSIARRSTPWSARRCRAPPRPPGRRSGGARRGTDRRRAATAGRRGCPTRRAAGPTPGTPWSRPGVGHQAECRDRRCPARCRPPAWSPALPWVSIQVRSATGSPSPTTPARTRTARATGSLTRRRAGRGDGPPRRAGPRRRPRSDGARTPPPGGPAPAAVRAPRSPSP